MLMLMLSLFHEGRHVDVERTSNTTGLPLRVANSNSNPAAFKVQQRNKRLNRVVARVELVAIGLQ